MRRLPLDFRDQYFGCEIEPVSYTHLAVVFGIEFSPRRPVLQLRADLQCRHTAQKSVLRQAFAAVFVYCSS